MAKTLHGMKQCNKIYDKIHLLKMLNKYWKDELFFKQLFKIFKKHQVLKPI